VRLAELASAVPISKKQREIERLQDLVFGPMTAAEIREYRRRLAEFRAALKSESKKTKPSGSRAGQLR